MIRGILDFGLWALQISGSMADPAEGVSYMYPHRAHSQTSSYIVIFLLHIIILYFKKPFNFDLSKVLFWLMSCVLQGLSGPAYMFDVQGDLLFWMNPQPQLRWNRTRTKISVYAVCKTKSVSYEVTGGYQLI